MCYIPYQSRYEHCADSTEGILLKDYVKVPSGPPSNARSGRKEGRNGRVIRSTGGIARISPLQAIPRYEQIRPFGGTAAREKRSVVIYR